MNVNESKSISLHSKNSDKITMFDKVKKFVFRRWISLFFTFLERKKLYYVQPAGLSREGWAKWEDNISESYPTLFALRENAEDFEDWLVDRFHDSKRGLRAIFRPRYTRVRKLIPRTYADVTHLIREVNFAFLLEFKEEADKSYVNWNATPEHKEFKQWLDTACVWIAEGQVNLKNKIEEIYDQVSLISEGSTYTDKVTPLYDEISRIEKLMEDTDTNILHKLIEYRSYMWT